MGVNKMVYAKFNVDGKEITFEGETLDIGFAMATANQHFRAVLGQGKWEHNEKSYIVEHNWIRGNFFD
tara:strand:- start:1390 stop:1593 length:204 start_codon:yes stop_codon:yes gene_type:complete